MENKIDLDQHPFELVVNNPRSVAGPKVLGHFSNLDLAVFTAAQRREGRLQFFVNGARLVPEAMQDALENYAQAEGVEVCDNG